MIIEFQRTGDIIAQGTRLVRDAVRVTPRRIPHTQIADSGETVFADISICPLCSQEATEPKQHLMDAHGAIQTGRMAQPGRWTMFGEDLVMDGEVVTARS